MTIGDTSGFYKIDGDSGLVICAPHFVHGSYDTYQLYMELKDTYTYPIDGWYWFDTENEAYAFFGLEWYAEVYTIGLPKPWLNETNNTQ